MTARPCRRLAVALLAALSVTGCPPPEPFTLELGSGADAGAFTPLTGGEVVSLVRGFQGGQHIWVSLRSKDVADGPARVRFSIQEPATEENLVGDVEFTTYLFPGADGYREVHDLILRVREPDRIVNRQVQIRAHVIDADSKVGVDKRTVGVAWEEESP